MLKVDIEGQFGSFPLKAKLDFPTGVTALVGPSGAGKSSLLRLVSGLDRPTSGQITLLDRVFCDVDRKLFLDVTQRRVGMVFQRPALLPHMSVMQNIALGARGGKIAEDLLTRTGCDRLIGKPIAGLSGGEQQRVMLARALVGRPDVVLMDEPLSALDPASKNNMLQLFAELFPLLDVPIVYVTHAMEEASRIAGSFVLLENGAVKAVGDAGSVFGLHGGSVENGISRILSGIVEKVADDGLATIDVGGQSVEIMGPVLAVGGEISLRVWARDVMLAGVVPTHISARNALAGTLTALRDLPDGQLEVSIDLAGQVLSAVVMGRTIDEMSLAVGQDIIAIFKSASIEAIS